MHRQSGPSLLCAGQVKDGIVWCTFGRRWYLPEMQEGSREPHASFVVLPGECAVQGTVELVGPGSCQFPGLTASHTCAHRSHTGMLGRALPGRVHMSLELLVVLCC